MHEFSKAYFLRPLIFSLLLAVFVILFASVYGGFFLTAWPTVLLAAVLLAACVGSVSPMLSKGHRMDGKGLHLRMGLRFRATVPWRDVVSVSGYSGSVTRRGVGFSLTEPVVYLVTDERSMVKVRLRPARFSQALWKRADTIVLSVRNPDRFMDEARKWMET